MEGRFLSPAYFARIIKSEIEKKKKFAAHRFGLGDRRWDEFFIGDDRLRFRGDGLDDMLLELRQGHFPAVVADNEIFFSKIFDRLASLVRDIGLDELNRDGDLVLERFLGRNGLPIGRLRPAGGRRR
jgi:hypothetical protein